MKGEAVLLLLLLLMVENILVPLFLWVFFYISIFSPTFCSVNLSILCYQLEISYFIFIMLFFFSSFFRSVCSVNLFILCYQYKISSFFFVVFILDRFFFLPFINPCILFSVYIFFSQYLLIIRGYIYHFPFLYAI